MWRRLPPSALLPPQALPLVLLLVLAATSQGWSWRAAGFAPPRMPAQAAGSKGGLGRSLEARSSQWTRQQWQQRLQRPRVRRRQGGARSLQCSGIQGWGRVGDRYSWHENEWEVEVTVPVPPGTTKKEVMFEATPTSLSLALAANASAPHHLMAGAIKGRITMDGTYWSLEGEGEARAVKLLLEKKAGALQNAWDWRRILADEPATETQYEEPERFDTKAYTRAMLGPDGINASLVDMDMFASGGLFQNVTKETLADYVEARVLDDASGLSAKKDEGKEEEKKKEKGEEGEEE